MPRTSEQNKAFRLNRTNVGLCEDCGESRGNNGTKSRCRKCANNANDRCAIYRLKKGSRPRDTSRPKWVKGENCRVCRNLLPPGRNTQRCEECSDKINQGAVIKKQQRHQENVCQNCGNSKPITRGEYHLCYSCYLRAAASRHLGSTSRWKELRDLWEKQKGICPYTKKQLTLGIDASVDHILPQSRYPELKNDIKNIEWIDFKVNLMKRDLTKDEFLALLKHIVNNAD